MAAPRLAPVKNKKLKTPQKIQQGMRLLEDGRTEVITFLCTLGTFESITSEIGVFRGTRVNLKILRILDVSI